MASSDTMSVGGQIGTTKQPWRVWKRVGIVAGSLALLLVAAVAGLYMWMSYVPADLSDAGRFPVAAGPVADPAAKAAWEQMAPEDQELVRKRQAQLASS